MATVIDIRFDSDGLDGDSCCFDMKHNLKPCFVDKAPSTDVEDFLRSVIAGLAPYIRKSDLLDMIDDIEFSGESAFWDTD